MEVNRVDIAHSSRSDKFNLIALGDTHLGTRNFAKERFKEMVEWIRETPHTYWIGMGDYCEYIPIQDKRFDIQAIDVEYQGSLGRLPRAQTDAMIEYLMPIKDKCIGMHDGNHELSIKKYNSIDPTYEICSALGTKWLGYAAFTRLTFERLKGRRQSFDIYSTHSRVSGRMIGNKGNYLEKMCINYDADIMLIAHGHRKTCITISRIGLPRTNARHVKDRKMVAGMTGSFFRTYTEGVSSYAEQAGYPPSDLGVIKVTMEPDTGNLHISE